MTAIRDDDDDLPILLFHNFFVEESSHRLIREPNVAALRGSLAQICVSAGKGNASCHVNRGS